MTPRRVTLLLVAGVLVIVLAVWMSSKPRVEQVPRQARLFCPAWTTAR
jgi:hypothetical protein